MVKRISPVNSSTSLMEKMDKGVGLEKYGGTDEQKKKPSVSFEKAFESVGEFGRYQIWIIVIFFLISIVAGTQVMISYFVAFDPPWMCESNSSTCTTHNMTFPSTDKSRCDMKRSDWRYVESSTYSVVTQYDLSCSRQWLSHLINSAFFLGWAIGAILLGSAADNYGRKTVIFPSFATMVTVTAISAFSPNIYLYVVLRFIVGVTIPGTFVQLVILVTELVGIENRAWASQIVLIGFPLGASLLGVIAYFVREWKYLLLYTSLPYLPLLLSYKFVSESLSWLLTKDRTEDLIASLKHIAYWNKKNFSGDIKISKPMDIVKETNSTIIDIFRTKTMFIFSMIQGFAWFSNSVVYFGLYFAADDLGGSMYRDFIILSVVDIPGNILTAIMIDRLGRKKAIISTMIISGASCVSVGFVAGHSKAKIIKIAIGTLGKILSLIAFSGFYNWSSEIYSTEVRSIGNGWTQFNCRVGAASAPWIISGMKVVSEGAPYVVMGVLVIVASFFCFALHETKNTNVCTDEEKGGNNNEKIGNTTEVL